MIGERIGSSGRRAPTRRLSVKPFVGTASAILALLAASLVGLIGISVVGLLFSDQRLGSVLVALFAIGAGVSVLSFITQRLNQRQLLQHTDLLALNRRENERYFARLQARLAHRANRSAPR